MSDDPFAPPSPETALARLQEFAAEGPILVPRGTGDNNNRRARATQLVIDTEFARKACLTGLATLVWRAEQGCVRAAIYLVDRFMGAPAQSITVQVAGMPLEEVRERLYQEYRRQGFEHHQAERLVEVAERSADQAALESVGVDDGSA